MASPASNGVTTKNRGWQARRRTIRRTILTGGSGFHEFKGVPTPWALYAIARCTFCRRGEKDGLTGLWEFGAAWVCTDCAQDIVDDKMPVAWTDK